MGETWVMAEPRLIHVKPCKTLEEEHRDEYLKSITPYQFQIERALAEEKKEQDLLEQQQRARKARLEMEERAIETDESPGIIYYDEQEFRNTEDAIEYVYREMQDKGVYDDGYPLMYRRKFGCTAIKPIKLKGKEIPLRITYHKLPGYDGLVRFAHRPAGMCSIRPTYSRGFSRRKWIKMERSEIKKLMRWDDEMNTTPSQQPAIVALNKKDSMTNEPRTSKSDCHKPSSEKELIRKNQILMDRFRADVISSKTSFQNGEKAKVYLKNTSCVKFDYGTPPPDFEEPRTTRRKLKEGAYPNWTVEESKLPKILRYAWKNKPGKLVKYLETDSGMNKINRIDYRGRTALHYAASWGDIDTVKTLIKCPGIDLNMRDEHGKTPLYKAVELGDMNCVKALVESGANVLIPARDSRDAITFLLHFYGDERFDLFEYLWSTLPEGAKKAEEGRMTYIHKAVVADHSLVLLKCLDHMICDEATDINAKEGEAKSALHVATILERADLVALLIAHKANPMHFDERLKQAIAYTDEKSFTYKLLSDYYKTGPGQVSDALFRRDVDCPINRRLTREYRKTYFGGTFQK